ncbi:glycosyltransferase family 4 protein [Candidatus Uhrbacteria bacterium]|nr:glycosyltransferase family 4 protein [Candidatus Uhrbacteria bacterium]
MKIGIVSNLYPSNTRGGAELVAQRVADALYERGHEVFVFTTQPYDGIRSLFPRVRERTLEVVYRFFPLNVYALRNASRMPFPVRALWHLIDLLSPWARAAVAHVIVDECPDVMITHNLKGIGVGIAREIQRRGVPHIHTLHDVQLSVPSGLLIAGHEQSFLNRSFLRRWYEAIVRRQIGTPDLVLSPSKFLADFYRERGLFTDVRLEVLPNPLPPGNRPELPKERPQMKTKFLFVGQLEEHKGVHVLLDALDQFGDDVEMHFAGEGSLAEFVNERALRDARVTFHGFVSLKNLVRLLENTDAVVLPSICYENSPTVIYESFLVGVPVVASHIGGIPELVEDGESGLLVAPGDTADLARAMRRIHSEREIWWGRTNAIRAYAQQFALGTYVTRLEQLIEGVIQKENPPQGGERSDG